jgi:23S rRNA pseudouridine2457 synthase
VQVEHIPTANTLEKLAEGLRLGDQQTLPCRAWRLEPEPAVPPREPPIRARKTVPDCWLALELTEGKNRQVRRMTAAIGHPTLRLLRVRIGALSLTDLDLIPGAWRELTEAERALVFADQT